MSNNPALHNYINLRTLSVQTAFRFTYQLHDDLFDELTERVGWMLLVQMMDELRNDLGVGVRLESVATLLQECLHLLVVGDDTVVDDHERVVLVGSLWM